VTAGTLTREDRVLLARAALARAEERTGARSVLPIGTRPEPPVVTLVPEVPQEAPVGIITSERPPMAVPPALATLLPEGLRRGATTVVTGSTSLVLVLLAHACAGGAWAAVVGQPRCVAGRRRNRQGGARGRREPVRDRHARRLTLANHRPPAVEVSGRA